MDETFVFKSEEGIRATGRNMNRFSIFAIELACNPIQVCFGLGPQINNYVMNASPQARKGLALTVWGYLIMKPPKSKREPVLRDIRLFHRRGNSMLAKFLNTEMSAEHASMIREWFGFDNEYALYLLFEKLHRNRILKLSSIIDSESNPLS
jgi:hypothetical protein